MANFSKELAISITPSRGRYLRLTVDGKTANVTLHLPKGVSEREAEAFVLSKSEWINKARQKVLLNIERDFPGEGKIALLGKTVNVIMHDNKTCFDGQALYINARNASGEGRQKQINAFYKKTLTEYVSATLPDWEARMGVESNGFSIRDMSSRWGSCNVVTKKITFGLRLCKKPLECIDYVIAHELAHLKFPNHGKEFKTFLSSVMPDWKSRKNLLNGVK